LAGFRRAGDPIFIGRLLDLQARAVLDMPGYDPQAIAPEARQLLAKARQYYNSSPWGARELPRLDIIIGFLEYNVDAPVQARAAFDGAARTCRRMRDWDCYATATQNLARVAEADNDYAFALSAYGDALGALPRDLNPQLSADIQNNLGRLQGVVGLFSSSARSQAAAMREYARLEDCPGVRRSLARSGNLLEQVGSLGDAENDLQLAASLSCPELLLYASSQVGQTIFQAAAADPTVGPLRASVPTHDSRAGLCTRSLEATGLANDKKEVVFNSLLSLSDALVLDDESAQAQLCLKEAEHYASSSHTRIRLANARGTALLERGDAVAARAEFERALQIADIAATYEHRVAAQIGIARADLLAGKATGALQDLSPALQLSVARGDINQTVTCLRLIAASYRGLHDTATAARTLQVATSLIEAVPIDELDGEKRATYLATQHTAFAELTDLFASQPDAWAGFATSERGRARSLRYAVNQETRNAANPLEAPPAARYRQLLRNVVKISSTKADSSTAELINELQDVTAEGAVATDLFDRRQLTQTLSQLDANLVEYAVGDHDMFAFVVDGDNVRVTRLGDRAKISNAARDLYDLLRDAESPTSAVRAAAEQLARLILWPITEALQKKRIVVVPDDALHTVPFSALPWSADAAAGLVLKHAEVSIVPSALFLARSRSLQPGHLASPRIELIGDPVFAISDWHRECSEAAPAQAAAAHLTRTVTDWTESLPRLPGSREEVLEVAQLSRQTRPGSHIEMLLGCAAVPSALRHAMSEHVDLLHIATHARVDAQRPRLSALALTPEGANGVDVSTFGLLDILGLKLNSHLVVLSACETSRGRLLPGEGVLGPAQAFLQAGSEAVLASYWRIDDRLTSNFMRQFYKYLLVEHLSASAALQRAQLDQAATSPAYDWAAFALYGWPDSGI
jgi:CHAT domain-containing protein/tetratricopeptide (TPR) repeat protein